MESGEGDECKREKEGETEEQEIMGVGYFVQEEGGIRDLMRSRGCGEVYKRLVCRWALRV